VIRVAITTLGCKANWSDSEGVARALSQAGLSVVGFDSEADLYIINTCTVTGLAAAQSRQMVRRAVRRVSGAKVVAMGCLGETGRDELARIAGVDEVFGADERGSLIDYVLALAGRGAASSPDPDSALACAALGPQSRARAFLKIQDGCDRSCSYCIITKARGASRSVPIDEVVRRARELGRHHREIVLTGIDIGQYGSGLEDGANLEGLLELLAQDESVPRLRLSSLDPTGLTAGIVSAIAGGGVCRHVHLSLQSASDPVLRAMRRRYTSREALRTVERLLEAVPGIAVTADIIAGFPGEAAGDHESTVEMLESMPLAGMHVFPYSAMAGTAAAGMPGQVPHGEKRRRAAQIRRLAQKKRLTFLNGLIGSSMDVIVTSEEPDDAGVVEAFSDNAVVVRLGAGIVGYAEMGRARVTGTVGGAVSGEWE